MEKSLKYFIGKIILYLGSIFLKYIERNINS